MHVPPMRSQSESLFFLGNDHEVNRLVFKMGGIFMAVLLGILAAAYFDVFKVSPQDVLIIIGLLFFFELIFFVLLKVEAPVQVTKYYGLLSMECCLMVMISNAYFGVYICYILVPLISCLYFDRKLTLCITSICYLGMLAALWFRASEAIVLAFPGYTQLSWFIAFGLGYTLEYIAIAAVLFSLAKRSRHYMEELHRRKEEISDIQSKTIYRFADLVECRDGETGKHVKRTSRYVTMIAKRLRKEGPYAKYLTKDDIVHIELAAPLHDIGKIKISDTILLKPGKLTPQEFAIIQTHTTAGGEIIESAMKGIEREDFVKMARDIAVSHHEKWDGSGYPKGLSGTDISLPARIMAVADVFDALVSDRCYKSAVSIEEAFDVLRESRGTHFDPYLVDVFIGAQDEIREIMAAQ